MKRYFFANNLRISDNDPQIFKHTGIKKTLTLINANNEGDIRASGIIDNPSKVILEKVSKSLRNQSSIKCYLSENHSSINKLILGNEEFEF